MQVDDVKPQHDLDERKRLGREIGLANARRSQGSASITDAGREALGNTQEMRRAMRAEIGVLMLASVAIQRGGKDTDILEDLNELIACRTAVWRGLDNAARMR